MGLILSPDSHVGSTGPEGHGSTVHRQKQGLWHQQGGHGEREGGQLEKEKRVLALHNALEG